MNGSVPVCSSLSLLHPGLFGFILGVYSGIFRYDNTDKRIGFRRFTQQPYDETVISVDYALARQEVHTPPGGNAPPRV